MIPELAACFLLGVIPVRDCDPRAQVYAHTGEQIPIAHLRMVSEIGINDKNHGEAIWPSMVIELPAEDPPMRKVLAHEVGHIVAATLNLNEPYARKLWRKGKPIGRTSEYGHRTSLEDFADCYAAIIHHSTACDAQRVTWLRAYAFKGTQYE